MLKLAPGYEAYGVDEAGRIWRVNAPCKKPLTATKCKKTGYLCVTLSKNGVKKWLLAHRVVASAFRGPCPPGQEVRHKNGIRDDIRPSNLVYGTKIENTADKAVHGRPHRGETHPRAKLTEIDVRRIRAATQGIRALAREYGVNRTTVDRIRSRENWSHLI